MFNLLYLWKFNKYIYLLIFYIIIINMYEWNKSEIQRRWSGVASSADGNHIVVTALDDFIYTSNDFGVNWTPHENKRDWSAIASSSDGSKLVATTFGDFIYTSNDFGVNWTPSENKRSWSSVALSYDGNRIIAAAINDFIYISNDFGINWIKSIPTTFNTHLASSEDGSKLFAINEIGYLFISNDFGRNWKYEENVDINYTSIVCSANGNKVVKVGFNTKIDISNDSGKTWTSHFEQKNWISIASSKNCTKFIAAATDGYLYISKNSGIDWVRNKGATWKQVASSSNGNKLIAISKYHSIYTNIPIPYKAIYDNLNNVNYLIPEFNDKSLLMLAVEEDNLDMFNLFINDKYLFIDQFDNTGKNLLMNAILSNNIDIIEKLIAKEININAVDIYGNTSLHYALTENNDTIIALLCSLENIVPFIPNNKNKTAICLSIKTKYNELVKSTAGINIDELLNREWKGITFEYLKNLFDFQYIDKDKEGDNIFTLKEDRSPCSACLTPLQRESACNHIQHDCPNSFSESPVYLGKGGIVPYWNIKLRTIPDHGNERILSQICHICCICGTTYAGKEDRPPMEYPIRFRPGTESKITHDYWHCPYNFKLKYYRIHKIIEKIIELQPKTGTPILTYNKAMEEITLAGANVIFDQIPAGELDRVIRDIQTRKTFLPEDISSIPKITMEELYPQLGIVKKIPNMRKMEDVIINNLKPEIIFYNEIKNKDGTSKDPPEFDSEDDYFTMGKYQKFIRFYHREFTIDNNYRLTDHENISLDTFISYFFTNTSNPLDIINFGKCLFFAHRGNPDGCKSYLYPEELEILFNEKAIDHKTYITYRNNFQKSQLIKIEYSPDAMKYFLPAPQPDRFAAMGGNNKLFKEKYLKYKTKYLILKGNIKY